jgi:hypothetical protein
MSTGRPTEGSAADMPGSATAVENRFGEWRQKPKNIGIGVGIGIENVDSKRPIPIPKRTQNQHYIFMRHKCASGT